MRSEQVVIQSPTSYVGSARRIWRLAHRSAILIPAALLLVLGAWAAITAWYMLFGLLVVPWRLLRRGQRKRKQETMRHRELMGR